LGARVWICVGERERDIVGELVGGRDTSLRAPGVTLHAVPIVYSVRGETNSTTQTNAHVLPPPPSLHIGSKTFTTLGKVRTEMRRHTLMHVLPFVCVQCCMVCGVVVVRSVCVVVWYVRLSSSNHIYILTRITSPSSSHYIAFFLALRLLLPHRTPRGTTTSTRVWLRPHSGVT
jgi:hypothetical protein